MDYAAAVAYLDEHASYDKTGRVTSPSLDHITRLVNAMGEPQHAYPVIHVTGTNGKGSTAQMITRLLMAQGLSVGTYTSPHLERVNERLARSAAPIDDDDFAEQIAAIADLEGVTGVRPSYFEACTAAAFRWFADIAVDVAVIEVGLLGRWDATNVVTAQVAVITNIGMDHNEFAGPTLVDIAREKAGIIKPSSAAVIGELEPELVAVLSQPEAATRLRRGVDFETAGNQLAVGGRLVDLRTPTTIYPEVYVPLHGAHQGDNAVDRPGRHRGVLRRATRARRGRGGLRGRRRPGPLRDPRAPAARDRRRRPQPARRRHVRPGLLRRLRARGPADPRGRHPPRAEGDARGAAGRRVRRGRGLHRSLAPRRAGRGRRQRGRGPSAATRCSRFDTVGEACRWALRSADGDDAVLAAGSLYVAGEARRTLLALHP